MWRVKYCPAPPFTSAAFFVGYLTYRSKKLEGLYIYPNGQQDGTKATLA